MSDWRERAEAIDWKARAEAAEAKLHELSVKYVVALDLLREIAGQKLYRELGLREAATADFEGAYDEMIAKARTVFGHE